MSAHYLTDPWSGIVQQQSTNGLGQSASLASSLVPTLAAYPGVYGQYAQLGAYQPSSVAYSQQQQQYGQSPTAAATISVVAGLGQSYPSAFQSAVIPTSASSSSPTIQQQRAAEREETATSHQQRRNDGSNQQVGIN
jgi:hypothetical protein